MPSDYSNNGMVQFFFMIVGLGMLGSVRDMIQNFFGGKGAGVEGKAMTAGGAFNKMKGAAVGTTKFAANAKGG
ncbi:MAG: hypothetical protein FWD32_02990, partial [Firmicutes bacterium]|nr:hypothetical protein [Bacillota bacterium]